MEIFPIYGCFFSFLLNQSLKYRLIEEAMLGCPPLWSPCLTCILTYPSGPGPAEQTSEPPTAKQCLFSLPRVCTPPPQQPQYLMVSGKCLCPHCSPHLMALPCQPFCILLTPLRESPQPSVWALDAGVLERRCSALPVLDAPSPCALPLPLP